MKPPRIPLLLFDAASGRQYTGDWQTPSTAGVYDAVNDTREADSPAHGLRPTILLFLVRAVAGLAENVPIRWLVPVPSSLRP